MATRALITGITGQDGPILAAHLLSLGHEVTGMLRGQNNARRAEVEALVPDAMLAEADLFDGGSLLRMLDAVQPDAIYHLAAHRRGPDAASEMIGATTALGTERVLESVRIAAGMSASHATAGPRIFCAASHEIFGSAPRTVDEASAPSPETVHGIASAYAFETAGRYRRLYGMRITRGIMFEHVAVRGEGGAELQRIARDVIAVARGEQHGVRIAVHASCDIGHADDYARAMHLALEHDAPEDFVIAMGERHTLGEFALKAWRLAGAGRGRIVDGGPAASGPIALPKKARIMLGWRPERTIDDVVAAVVESEMSRADTGPTTAVPRRADTPARRVTWAAGRGGDDDVTIPLPAARAA
jgi:GDPmannose 4,6-dehydratase